MKAKRSVNFTAVIIYVSVVLFFLRLYACRFVFPEFTGMDYYGYIELGRNIFHRLDFTVRWELDSPVQYPPFFSILIYGLSYWTKDFVVSIQYISIFCTSFYLIPLFSLVRNVLNVYCAGLAVMFATYYFGIKPCYLLNMDFFYSFLIMIICWLVLDTLTNHCLKAGRYVLAGVLIGVADLTKYSGVLFGLASIGSILYYFVRYQQDLKAGLKFSAFLLLGAAPLFMTYHLLLDHHSKSSIPSIGTHVFFDGNYYYEKGTDYREEKISELNSEGTEFCHVTRTKTDNISHYILNDPVFMLNKYMWGLDKMTQHITFSVLPGGTIPVSKFIGIKPDGDKILNTLLGNGSSVVLKEVSPTEVQINPENYLTADIVRKAAGDNFDRVWHILEQSRILRKIINVLFQGAFLFLLIFSGSYFKWPFKIAHILFFISGVAVIPLCSSDERYLIPFMPMYFVLWLFIASTCYGVIQTEIKDKGFLRKATLVLFICLAGIYGITAVKQIYQRNRYYGDEVRHNEMWLQIASWIKKDPTGPFRRVKIMAFNNYLAYLTDSDYIRLPYHIDDWNKVINFAVRRKVDYLLIAGDYVDSFLKFSDKEFSKTMTPQTLIEAIKTRGPVPSTVSAIAALNKLLESRDLYRLMPRQPVGSIDLIHRLQRAEPLNFLELRQLNRLLIEANYPKESPHDRWLGLSANSSERFKIFYGINVNNNTAVVLKL